MRSIVARPLTPALSREWRGRMRGGRARKTCARACTSATILADPRAIDEELSERMDLVREIVSLGRTARMGAKLKVRQPLAKVEVVLADRAPSSLARRPCLADRRRAERQTGRVPRAGRALHHLQRAARLEAARPAAGQATARAPQGAGRGRRRRAVGPPGIRQVGDARAARRPGRARLLDLQVRLQAKPGWAAAQGAGCVVVLSTEIDELLLRRGWPASWCTPSRRGARR